MRKLVSYETALTLVILSLALVPVAALLMCGEGRGPDMNLSPGHPWTPDDDLPAEDGAERHEPTPEELTVGVSQLAGSRAARAASAALRQHAQQEPYVNAALRRVVEVDVTGSRQGAVAAAEEDEVS